MTKLECKKKKKEKKSVKQLIKAKCARDRQILYDFTYMWNLKTKTTE